MSGKVAVVAPLYRSDLNDCERRSLERLDKILQKYHRIAVIPSHLSSASWPISFNETKIFEDSDFVSVDSYNRLMLSARFYDQFSDYEWVLIYQTDALVFSDQLEAWCDQPYDYIGAPWASNWAFEKGFRYWRKWPKAWFYQRLNIRHGDRARRKWGALRVGNGGFSLRRVPAFRALLQDPPTCYWDYLKKSLPDYPEDFFWGIDANLEQPRLRIPSWKCALEFAVESCPDLAVKYMGRRPFGAHGWGRGDQEIWESLIKEEDSYGKSGDQSR